jgi:hypothetical protein
MKVVNKVEIKLEKFDKCHMICDADCPLGQLYDYSCAFKAFISQKIRESETQTQPARDPDIMPEVVNAE